MAQGNRNRFSLSLTLRIPTNPDNTVDRIVSPNKSIPDMSQPGESSSNPTSSAAHPIPTSPVSPAKAFPILPMNWPRSPLSRKHSLASQETIPATPTPSRYDAKGRLGIFSKARKLGRLVISRRDESEIVADGGPNLSPKDTPGMPLVPIRSNSSPHQKVSRNLAPVEPSVSIPLAHDMGLVAEHRLSSQSNASSSKLIDPASDHTSLPEQTGSSVSPFDPSTNISQEPDTQSTHSYASPVSLAVLDAEDQQTSNLTGHIEECISPEPVREEKLTSPSAWQTDTVDGLNKRKQRRIKSVDLSALRSRRTPSVNTDSARPGSRDALIKRSRSLWTGIAHRERPKTSAGPEFQSSYGQNLADKREPDKPMSERQRTLNVKRARKMAQMFGSEPPPGLYLADKGDDDDLAPLSEENRHSIATLLSLSSVDLLSITPTHVRADSTDSVDPTECLAHRKEVTPDPTARPPFAGLVHTVTGSQPTSQASCLLQSTSLEQTASFRDRRRRAAKLSRFFGVTYQDLTSLHAPASSVALTSPDGSKDDESNVKVDIKVNEPGRFWGLSDGRQNLHDADVVDVIDKLRGLRAG